MGAAPVFEIEKEWKDRYFAIRWSGGDLSECGMASAEKKKKKDGPWSLARSFGGEWDVPEVIGSGRARMTACFWNFLRDYEMRGTLQGLNSDICFRCLGRHFEWSCTHKVQLFWLENGQSGIWLPWTGGAYAEIEHETGAAWDTVLNTRKRMKTIRI